MKNVIIVDTKDRINPGTKNHWTALLANPNNKVTSVACCDDITRVEVIDWKDNRGRVFTHWDRGSKVWADIQDQGRTLKLFIEPNAK